MRARRLFAIGLQLLGIAGTFPVPAAHAFGLWSTTQKSYVLNLCEYYELYNTRFGRINSDLRLTHARVTAVASTASPRDRSANCTATLSQSENVETKVHSNIIVELENLSQTLDGVHERLQAQLGSNPSCVIEREIEVQLTFSKISNGVEVRMAPFVLKRSGRGGVYRFETEQGKRLALLAQELPIKDPAELVQPELRCAQ